MLYPLYEAQCALLAPGRTASTMTANALRSAPGRFSDGAMLRRLGAFSEVASSVKLTHTRRPFGIDSVVVAGETVAVHEEPALVTPFATLLHFRADVAVTRPVVLLVAPMSGHFATMLRATVRTLLQDHDVYVTDWHNARDIDLAAGVFGYDDYVGHLLQFMRELGPDTHVLAVCQPCPAALIAVSVLAQAGDPAQPKSLTLMSGPIDARVNPTKMNETANRHSIEWYRKRCITTVPKRWPGAGRRVYPGFLQVSAFMSMNARRHVSSHVQMYRDYAADDIAGAEATREFYREYYAVLDIAEDFYLQTVSSVFQEHILARGMARYQDQAVEPAAIKSTALFTIEAANDDMCAPGQTSAAHDLASSLKPGRRARLIQPGVGHYGIFAGRRWQAEVYPALRDFIEVHG